MSVAVIINPISGGAPPGAAAARAQIAVDAVERAGETPEVFITERAGHARELAKSAAARGVRLIVAWGGDGTINEVATALAFGDVPLAIVPAGSGNGLATELGIDRRAPEALASALAGAPRKIDLGELGGRLFANVAGVGLDAYVAARFNDVANTRRGFLAYARITGRALVSYVPAEYRISTDDGRVHARAVLVDIANGAQYGNNARIAPDARVDDGLLDLVLVEERSRARTLQHIPKLFRGHAHRIPGYSTRRIRQATIEADQPMTFHVDGEPVLGGTRLETRVHPGALWIVV
jgi:diacylglycerol kinase (ATP)